MYLQFIWILLEICQFPGIYFSLIIELCPSKAAVKKTVEKVLFTNLCLMCLILIETVLKHVSEGSHDY